MSRLTRSFVIRILVILVALLTKLGPVGPGPWSRARRRSAGAALAVAAIVWAGTAGPAHALDLAVDTFGDSAAGAFQACTAAAGDCTLRGALLKANAVAGPHTITLPAGTYTLSIQNFSSFGEDAAQTGDLDILQTITINGVSPAATVITWDESIPVDNRDRIFEVLPAGNLTVRDVSLRQGAVPFNALGGVFCCRGGAILSRGALTVERASIRINTASSGGGLFIAGPATIRDSTINNNTAVSGGGIVIAEFIGLPNVSPTSIVNTTISTNNAGDAGGLQVNASPSAIVTLNSVTVANNSANNAGGIRKINGSLFLQNTLVAVNVGSSSHPNCDGTISSQGFNLVFGGDTCGMSAANGDIVNTGDPWLSPLQDNGGPTATHALGVGSAALDGGNPAPPGSGGNACAAADQRGLQRTIDGNGDGDSRCDIGAAEGGRWYAVDTTTDSNAVGFQVCDTNPGNGNCSLRGAISRANAGGFASVISLPAAGAGNPYRLTVAGAGEDLNATGDLDIRSDITLVGGGASTTIVDGNGTDRVFDVFVNSFAHRLTLQDVTVQNGNSGPTDGGGGIRAVNRLTLLRVRVRGNTGPKGGGIFIGTTSASLPTPVLIRDSTINDNTASGGSFPYGGGIYQFAASSLTVINTTIAGNRGGVGGESGAGGGIRQEANNGTFSLTLANVTMAGNSANLGGGISLAISAIFRNTIVAHNTNTAGGASPNCHGGTFTSQGFNLVFGGDTCGFTQGTDRQNQDPRLGPLQNNGGPTETLALGAGSAAIDAGNPATPGSSGLACAAADQRGIPRPVDGDGVSGARCDIGAYEAALCTTRPRVAVQTERTGPGQVRTTITAGAGQVGLLRLGQPRPLQNAVVNVQGGPQNVTAAQDVTVNAAQVVFTVTRLAGTGTAVTVPFQIVDECSPAQPWSSFVGFGSGI